MATKSRYFGYVRGVQHIRNKKKKTSAKESVLSRMKELREKKSREY